ncbi:glycerol-3-phosphate 1-O-acyltransferase [Actinomycetes bacterium M1A6_2h]
MSQLDSRRASTGSNSRVYLIDAMSDLDVQAANQWIDDQTDGSEHRPASVVMSPDNLAEFTDSAAATDPLVVPVRVSHRAPDQRLALSRRVVSRLSKPILRWAPAQDADSWTIVVGEPATLSDLRERFDDTGGRSLPSFIARQASLALDRAEREVIGSEYKVPRFVVEEMTDRASFRTDMAELAKSADQSVDDVENRVHEILDEMVATENHRAVDLWGQLGKYFSRAYNVEVDQTGLQAVRDLNKTHPLVFLPNHRSYLDPLVLRPALLKEGFPMNHVMGGINVGFWPIGPLAKRSGVVLIQRKFSDEIYKWTLRQYMSFLLGKKFNLEWYIEGGRSRTGKLRPPRFGLLTYLFDALDNSTASDAYLVPTSITYDRLHEVSTMAEEMHGAQKQAEGIRMAIGYIRAQGKIRGTVYLSFGTPMSVRSFLDANEDKRVAVQKAALAVSHAINEATPVTPAALVAMAMLGIEDRALNVNEMWSIIAPLSKYIRDRGLPTAGGIDLQDVDVMTTAIRAQVAAGVVKRFDQGPEPLFHLAQDKHLVLAFFRNNAIHFFVMRAIGELVVLRTKDCPTGVVAAEDLWKSALELRDLLKFEFFFGDKHEFGERLEAEVDLIDPQWRTAISEPAYAVKSLESQPFHLAHRVLQPIFEAYQVVAEQLLMLTPGREFDKAAFLTECLGAAQAKRLRQQLEHSDAISNELFDTALQLADNRDLLDSDSAGVTLRRRDFAAEIASWARVSGQIRVMAHMALDKVDADVARRRGENT